MFKISDQNKYLVTFIKGGQGQRGGYTFITIDDELRPNQKYADKLKINVWGENLEDKISKGDFISILHVNELGLVNQKDPKDETKWYQNLTITCPPDAILVQHSAQKVEEPQKLEQIDVTDLPF